MKTLYYVLVTLVLLNLGLYGQAQGGRFRGGMSRSFFSNKASITNRTSPSINRTPTNFGKPARLGPPKFNLDKAFSGWNLYPNGKAAGKGFKANRKTIANPKTYQVYMKKGGYVGRTSGLDGAAINTRRRNAQHHKNGHLGAKHKVLLSSANRDAVRGAEDILIRRQMAKGKATNRLRGISDKNKNLQHYWNEAWKEFGLKFR